MNSIIFVLLIFFVLPILLTGCTKVSIAEIAHGDTLNTNKIQVVLSADDEWESFWENLGTKTPVPPVDFDLYQVIAIVSHGNRSITKIIETKDKQKIVTKEFGNVSSYTYQAIKIIKSKKSVVFG